METGLGPHDVCDLTGVRCISGNNHPIMRRFLLVVLGLFGVYLPLVAQQTNRFGTGTIALEPWRQLGDLPFALALYQPDILSMFDGSMLSLGERRLPVAYLSAGQGEKRNASPADRADSSAGVFTLRLDPAYSGGEIGVLYGRGQHGSSALQSYIVGTVGNDKFQITAGASYEESSVRIPSWRLNHPK